MTIGNPAQITRDGLVFDVYESGPADGEPVVLLHGFPQFSDCWDAVVPLLNEAGYRTVAMDQRGYSPGARPRGRRRYTLPQLVADAAALLDHVGGPSHVVGHDWGAIVAWGLATSHPEKVCTLTAVSVPHPGAFRTSLVTSAQALKLWYMLFFQLPWVPEKLLTAPRAGPALVRSGQSRVHAYRDVSRLAGHALTGPLNWYRAIPFGDPRSAGEPVRVPTLLVWSDGDVAVGRASVDACGKYVQAPYRLEVLQGVSHWIPDEAPAELAALLLPHLRR